LWDGCMCVWTHTHTHVYIFIYIYITIHHTHTHTHTYTHTHIYTCIHNPTQHTHFARSETPFLSPVTATSPKGWGLRRCTTCGNCCCAVVVVVVAVAFSCSRPEKRGGGLCVGSDGFVRWIDLIGGLMDGPTMDRSIETHTHTHTHTPYMYTLSTHPLFTPTHPKTTHAPGSPPPMPAPSPSPPPPPPPRPQARPPDRSRGPTHRGRGGQCRWRQGCGRRSHRRRRCWQTRACGSTAG
jgi:hypothetical protein